MHQPAGFCACLLQRIDKRLVILLIEENCIPPVPPAHHMVDRSDVFNSRFSWHQQPMPSVAEKIIFLISEGCPLFTLVR
jgi:hypothetical protein